MTVNQIRVATGWSQSQFANHFNMPVRTLQRWEIGQAEPRDYVIKMMHDLLVLQGIIPKQVGD